MVSIVSETVSRMDKICSSVIAPDASMAAKIVRISTQFVTTVFPSSSSTSFSKDVSGTPMDSPICSILMLSSIAWSIPVCFATLSLNVCSSTDDIW